jgi:divalent metal cation (Fe/Co/Zn/Cd) transporter
LRRIAWLLTVATIAWNSVEALVALGSGLLSRSIALVSFGLDSIIEVASAWIIAWRLAHQSDDPEANERAERTAVRLIALSFFALAGYVAVDATSRLVGLGHPPEESRVGLVLLVLSLLVMPALAWAKRRVARQLGSVALEADSNQTKICTLLSAVVLVGLAANAWLGWWWMDPAAGLVVAGVAVNEGRNAWASGDLCCEAEVPAAVSHHCVETCCVACPVPG